MSEIYKDRPQVIIIIINARLIMVKGKKLKELLIYSNGRFGELGIADFVSAFEEGISTFTF